MAEATITINGCQVPRLVYGTAWKEEATQGLVEQAIEEGFRGIDTANQRRHYHEAAVGEAIAASIQRGTVSREDLFVQTKYTPRAGQDHRLPYDPKAPVADQVDQSLASSLEHLGIDELDSFVLHAPTSARGLGDADWQAWRAIEAAHKDGRTRLIGISNVDAEQLGQLWEQAWVRPHFVQNRCFARTAWDRRVRAFCTANGITYQAFSLLTANRMELEQPTILQIAERHSRTVPQIVFRFALEAGMLPLTGTTDRQHMRDDLDVFDFQLEPGEVDAIEGIGVG